VAAERGRKLSSSQTVTPDARHPDHDDTEEAHMRGKTLHQRAADRAEELPGAELTHPFGAEWDVFKVRDKVFMLLTELAGESIVTLKAYPDDAVALRQQYGGITPGYHMNKKHWITVRPGPAVDARLVDELVTESYRLVVAGLPKRQRPVDPTTFALG
jgi:predicted DNA-binding protein (MmcQ/YjbR family)